MEVFAVAQQLLAVFLIADVNRVTAEEMEELGEHVGGAARDLGGEDGGWSEESLAGEPGEHLVGGGEKDGKAKGEVVGRVAGRVEEVAIDPEGARADGNEDFGFKELGY